MIEINKQEYGACVAYDELLDKHTHPRPAAQALFNYLNALPPQKLEARREAVEAAILTMASPLRCIAKAPISTAPGPSTSFRELSQSRNG